MSQSDDNSKGTEAHDGVLLMRELEAVQDLLFAIEQASEAVDEGYGIKAIAFMAANTLTTARDRLKDTPGAILLKKIGGRGP